MAITHFLLKPSECFTVIIMRTCPQLEADFKSSEKLRNIGVIVKLSLVLSETALGNSSAIVSDEKL